MRSGLLRVENWMGFIMDLLKKRNLEEIVSSAISASNL